MKSVDPVDASLEATADKVLELVEVTPYAQPLNPPEPDVVFTSQAEVDAAQGFPIPSEIRL